MKHKCIERKFNKRIEGVLQFVSDFEDFLIIPVGASAFIMGKFGNLAGYFEGSEKINEKEQRIFIQYVGYKRPYARSYIVPLKGEINLSELKTEKEYSVV